MAKFYVPLLLSFFLLSCKSTTYYISRHAERAGTMSSDPQLTSEGEKQALDLRDYLRGKNIKAVYSTNFARTKATAKPTSDLYSVPITIYNPAQGTNLVDSLKSVNKNNILIVGHSNTVDDLVNRLTGASNMTDLPETEYGSLFIVKKKGSNYSFEKNKSSADNAEVSSPSRPAQWEGHQPQGDWLTYVALFVQYCSEHTSVRRKRSSIVVLQLSSKKQKTQSLNLIEFFLYCA